jgi:hypothetical protein
MSRTDLPSELRGQKYTIFGNVEPIYRFHAGLLLPALQQRLAQPFDSIGETLQSNRLPQRRRVLIKYYDET